MTRLKGILALFAAALVFVLTACPNPSGSKEPEQYTVTFDSHDGTAVAAVTANAGTPIEKPADPVREGFAFTGWFSENGGTLYTWPHTLNANITMHAQWWDTSRGVGWHIVTFDSHGGSEVPAITAGVGTKVVKPGDPVREGYEFTGWFNAASEGTLYAWPHTLSASITMHAQWRDAGQPAPERYTVTFESHGGSEVPVITAGVGTKVAKPVDPVREGYEFTGWFNAASGGALYAWPHLMSASITMHAQWRDAGQPAPERYTVTFDSHGGTGVEAITADMGTAVAKPVDPVREGFAFTGWFNAASGGTLYAWPYTLSASITMHAQWRDAGQPAPERYTVTFESHGGTGVEVITADAGTRVTKPGDPARNGYNFTGWYSAASGGTQYTTWPYTLSSNVIMHAQWTTISYTIVYNNLESGDTVPVNPSVYTVEDLPISLAAPARTGYTFGGWFDNSGLTGNAVNTIAAGSSAGNKVFWAKWMAITYTLAYNANGGGGTMPPDTHIYGIEKLLAANAFTRTGYTFDGWNTASNGEGTAYANSESVSNLSSTQSATITLYAQWRPKTSVDISVWINQDGTILVSNSGVTISKTAAGNNQDKFTATVTESYSDIQWYVGGNPVPGSPGNAQAIEIDAADYVTGAYNLDVTVFKDGTPYSATIKFTVVN
jgi:uncharacterized repeat protein (TIGR02543 family)